MKFFQLVYAAAMRRTYTIFVAASGCSTNVAVCKDQPRGLPSMRAADAHVVGTAVGDLPSCRHVPRLTFVIGHGDTIHFMKMQRHVEVFVTLRGGMMGMGALKAHILSAPRARVWRASYEHNAADIMSSTNDGVVVESGPK
jgi:hypothetical protein